MKQINTLIFLLCGLLCITVLYSCKGAGNMDIGNKGDISVETTDSIEIQASTLLLDSLPTNNTGTMLSGKISDPDVGKVTTEPYLQLKVLTDLTKVPSDAAFDSLSLVMRYSGYNYGDTTQSYLLSAHRVKQAIVLRKLKEGNEAEDLPVFVDGPALYSSSSFEYEPVPLGSRNFKPKPSSKDSVIVPLSPGLGREFLKLILNKDKSITDPKDFLDYFKGMMLKTGNAGAILGFNTDSLKMYLHYHYINASGTAKKAIVAFGVNGKNMQFNHIDADRSNTLLKGLNYTNKELKSESTEGRTYLQAGTGMVTKIKMPGLEKFLYEKLSINKAELVIETNPDTYVIYKAPPSLILFVANKENVPKSIVNDPFSSSKQVAKFIHGNETGSNGKYIFKLTEFVNNARKGTYKDGSLLLSVPVGDLFSTVHRLNIKDKKQIKSIKLFIYYTKF